MIEKIEFFDFETVKPPEGMDVLLLLNEEGERNYGASFLACYYRNGILVEWWEDWDVIPSPYVKAWTYLRRKR